MRAKRKRIKIPSAKIKRKKLFSLSEMKKKKKCVDRFDFRK